MTCSRNRTCKKNNNTCSNKDKEDKPTLDSLVNKYLNEKIPRERFNGEELTEREFHEKYLSSLNDLTDFICGERNAVKIHDGERYLVNIHQWNLDFPSRRHIINDMGRLLKDIDEKSFKDFEELIDEIVKIKKENHINHYGDTAIYDFALRYGWNHNPRIIPEKFVYVHSKPKKAAKELAKLGYLSSVKRKLPLTAYPLQLRREGMTAADIEHFLCVFHKIIKKLPNRINNK